MIGENSPRVADVSACPSLLRNPQLTNSGKGLEHGGRYGTVVEGEECAPRVLPRTYKILGLTPVDRAGKDCGVASACLSLSPCRDTRPFDAARTLGSCGPGAPGCRDVPVAARAVLAVARLELDDPPVHPSDSRQGGAWQGCRGMMYASRRGGAPQNWYGRPNGQLPRMKQSYAAGLVAS